MADIVGPALGIYLFTRKGVPLLAAPSGECLPIEPAQVEGALALAGGFAEGEPDAAGRRPVSRLRYDGYSILGMRGERAIAAAVTRGPPDDLLPELERFLRRCERRLRRARSD